MERRRDAILSPEAREDYEAIYLHSLDMWGEQQADAYEAALDRAVARIEDYPEIGRTRDDLAPGLRTYPVERHIIVYRIEPMAVWINRILHGRRDTAAELAR